MKGERGISAALSEPCHKSLVLGAMVFARVWKGKAGRAASSPKEASASQAMKPAGLHYCID